MNTLLARGYRWLDFFVEKPVTRAGAHLWLTNGGMGHSRHIFHAHSLCGHLVSLRCGTDDRL